MSTISSMLSVAPSSRLAARSHAGEHGEHCKDQEVGIGDLDVG
jgi:hypothetical protein